MNIDVKNTARLSVRSMAEILEIFWGFLVFLGLKFEIGPENLFLVQKFQLISDGFWVIQKFFQWFLKFCFLALGIISP